MSGWEAQLRKGVVELAVLASIGSGETYGYRIVAELQQLAGLELTESTVYPVLARLARDGFLAIRAEESPSGPKRRYYRLTATGHARLHRIAQSWRTISESVKGLLEGAKT
jgi:PadR family transcriptional regulator, regulatory protein PadR